MDARVAPTRLPRATVWARHLANFGPLCAIAVTAFWLAFRRTTEDAPVVARSAYGLVVALNALALSTSSWSAMLGIAVRVAAHFGWKDTGLVMAPPTGHARTAVVLAVHEEDAARVFATARAIADDVAKHSIGALDVFVLSDSQSPDAIAAERAMFARVSLMAGPRLFYRRRTTNPGRKAGNVADFVRRWGGAYDFMVVLDADSLMSGACIARLVGAMEANPDTGLIQAMAYPVGRSTLFAQLQQFDARLVGPVFQAGVAFWQGPRGNFWGHNAIIRVASFADSCGLPTLPGRPPFGGEILSHDSVEAALLLRRGHDIWMLPHGPDGCPDESWEETPTNLLDHLERDRRWMRGNLQHVRVLRASGLKLASYYHLLRGLSHFLYAPLLVLWLCLYAVLDRRGAPNALALLILALALAPRVLGLAAALGDKTQVAAVGGRLALVVGTLLDQLVFALLYPVVLVSHIADLVALVRGNETRWHGQARDDRGLAWRETTSRLGPSLSLALFTLVVLAGAAKAPLALLLAPGLLCGVPLAVGTSRCVAARLFAIPEDRVPHPLRARRADIEENLRESLPPGGSIVPSLPDEAGLAMPTQNLRDRLDVKS